MNVEAPLRLMASPFVYVEQYLLVRGQGKCFVKFYAFEAKPQAGGTILNYPTVPLPELEKP